MTRLQDRPWWAASALEVAAAVRCGEVSPLEVFDAVAERIAAVEPRLNAFITLDLEAARERAAKAHAAVAAGATLGPLHGVPFSVKDLLNTAEVRTTFASKALEDNVPQTSCVAVDRLVRAGGILIGKTTTPEFGHKPMTEAPLFGRTVNPWDVTRTSGGSSGGAAAATATGCGPLAVGTDGGGSTRIPAAACGVVGVKQTLGVVPHDQTPDSFGLLAYVGPITRTVADAGLMLEVMSGPHWSDPHSQGRRVEGLARSARLGRRFEGVRVGYAPLLGNEVVDGETRMLVDAAVAVLERDGAVVEQIDEVFPSTLTVWGPLTFSIWAQRFGPAEQRIGDQMSHTLRTWMAQGRSTSGLEVQSAMEARTSLYRLIEGWLARYDVLVTPTLACPAVPIDHDPLGPFSIDGQDVGGLREGWYPYTHPFNLTGHPAVTVPAGWTAAGLPVGLQLVSRYFSDARLLGYARRFEQLAPWHDRYRLLDDWDDRGE